MDTFHQTLLRIKSGSQETHQLLKVNQIIQKPKEFPTGFLERMCEAYWILIPIDPDAFENQRVANIAFVM